MPDPELEPGPRWSSDNQNKPFQVSIRQDDPLQQRPSDHDSTIDHEEDEPLSIEEIEAAYLMALESSEQVEEWATATFTEALQHSQDMYSQNFIESENLEQSSPTQQPSSEQLPNDLPSNDLPPADHPDEISESESSDLAALEAPSSTDPLPTVNHLESAATEPEISIENLEVTEFTCESSNENFDSQQFESLSFDEQTTDFENEALESLDLKSEISESEITQSDDSGDLEVIAEQIESSEENWGPPRDLDFNTADLHLEQTITAHQVIEAVLFVGAKPVSLQNLVEVLGESSTLESVEDLLDSLNQRYDDEHRPYQILLQDDGYVMQLRAEHEPIRSRMYGQAPKEVKLAQDALEILAFVAYQQPVTKEMVESTEKKNAMTLLRQLLRRELVVLEREEGSKIATYRTTHRFLEVFGLQALEDLPRAGDFSFK